MKIALAGHLWLNHFRHVTGKNRDAVVHEETCPGGILWVSNLLKQAGLECNAPTFDANPRAEHYECLDTPVKEKKETRLSFRFLGCTPGASQATPEQADLLILLDEGFDPIEPVTKPDMLLWASKERVPDKNTTSTFPKNTILLLDADLLMRIFRHDILGKKTNIYMPLFHLIQKIFFIIINMSLTVSSMAN